MTHGNLVVNFAVLQSAAEDIRMTVDTMNSELDALKQALQPIVATWDGDAKNAYAARQAEWDRAANDLNTLLSSIQQAVLRSAEIMAAREQANMQRFGGR
jgi:early secretory antigenic target protein ESAT-6